jgi:hypothetical protein
MVKPIPQYGKTIRLTKETLEGLLPYDSDPNHAFLKMRDALNKPVVVSGPAQEPHPCKFDEGTIITAIKQGIKETLESFRE